MVNTTHDLIQTLNNDFYAQLTELIGEDPERVTQLIQLNIGQYRQLLEWFDSGKGYDEWLAILKSFHYCDTIMALDNGTLKEIADKLFSYDLHGYYETASVGAMFDRELAHHLVGQMETYLKLIKEQSNGQA